MKNERKRALDVLLHLNTFSEPLQITLKNDSPFVRELVYGACRYAFRLQAILGQLLARPLKDDAIHWLLILALYQLEVQKAEPYAVVKEMVDLTHRIKKSSAKGLVNACLRRFCRERDAILAALIDDAAFVYNHPAWLIEEMKADWPSHWQAILQANDERAPMTLRVNAQKTTRSAYLDALHALGIEARPTTYSPDGLVLAKPIGVDSLPHFDAGWVSVQDEAAQLVVEGLQLAPGLRVLDACAAPGGKTGHILEREPALSSVVALDIDERRLERVAENLKRQEASATLVKGDAATPEAWWDGVCFDRILLDAPCSALGVIRRHPDIKRLRTKAALQAVVETQKTLLHTLWPLLAPEGLLVYAVCSITRAEGDAQIEAFLQQHPEAKALPWPKAIGHAGQWGRYLLPGTAEMDGFYMAVLQKQAFYKIRSP